VLDAPEAACSDGGGLRARGHGNRCGGAVGHCGEGAEELGQKGHGEVGEEGEGEGGEGLQLERFERVELRRLGEERRRSYAHSPRLLQGCL
jgi:hypothetical protein